MFSHLFCCHVSNKCVNRRRKFVVTGIMFWLNYSFGFKELLSYYQFLEIPCIHTSVVWTSVVLLLFFSTNSKQDLNLLFFLFFFSYLISVGKECFEEVLLANICLLLSFLLLLYTELN